MIKFMNYEIINAVNAQTTIFQLILSTMCKEKQHTVAKGGGAISNKTYTCHEREYTTYVYSMYYVASTNSPPL